MARSVTGAPKVRALEVISELEATPREVYTGAIGYRSPVAGLELNVAIRTLEFHGDRVWLGSGGGITAASDPHAEYRECLFKAAPLIRALEATLGEEPASPSSRPRPALGVFTSLRVTGGRGRDLDRHLARLDDSTRRLFGKHLPPGIRTDLAARLAEAPSGRLRLTARPFGGPIHVTAEVVPVGPAPAAVGLYPITVEGGLGAHKWRDRRILDHAREQAGLGADQHLLILDKGGDVLETDRANVFALIDDNYDSFTYNLAHLLLGNDCHVEVIPQRRSISARHHDIRPGRHRHLPRPRHPRPTPGSASPSSASAGPRRRCSASASATRSSPPPRAPPSWQRRSRPTARPPPSPTTAAACWPACLSNSPPLATTR
jgi:chorismate binding enzyme/Amino-transferase class IV